MKIKNFKDEGIIETPHKVDVRKLYDLESAQVMHITLNTGESLKPHRTPVDVFFYVLEGNPTVHIESESVICCKDDLIESPMNLTHWLSNETELTARILVVKAPKPTNPSKIL